MNRSVIRLYNEKGHGDVLTKDQLIETRELSRRGTGTAYQNCFRNIIHDIDLLEISFQHRSEIAP